MYQKRGEISSTQIVLLVLAIIGTVFVFLLIPIFTSDSGLTDREICRLSILQRATAPDLAQANVPLKCQTEKICLTTSFFGGECNQFAGEENIRTVRLRGSDTDKVEAIEQAMAENMYFCWSMMGQGKLDLFGNAAEHFVGSSGDSSCVICSRLAFANDVPDELIAQVDVDDYLQRNKIPLPGATETYLQSFNDLKTDSFAGVSAVSESISTINDALDVDSEELPGELSNDFSNKQFAFVFSQVKTESVGDVLSHLGAAAVGSTFVLPGAAKLGSTLFLTKAGIVTLPLAAAGVGGVAWNTVQGQIAAAGYCGDYVSAVSEDELGGGCSLVQAVNYNVNDINSLCTGSIQSAP